MFKQRVVLVSLTLYVCLSGPVASSQEIYPQLGFSSRFGVAKFLNSFTSYQFPNPFPPQQDPLSRLEFPIDQWFAGLSSVYVAPSWDLKGQIWTNLNRESSLMMQDSDWDDDAAPNQKTIFSESKCRLNRGVLIDISCSLGILPHSLLIRPIGGYRYQHFFFTTHDGFQASLSGDAFELPGDGIDFRQSFHHGYIGGVYRMNLDMVSPLLAQMHAEFQVDYALVVAKNEDLHLLRSGDHVTMDNTRGHCWHISAAWEFLFTSEVRGRVTGDFKRLVTDGDHRLKNSLFALDFSFGGSKVWSDQFSLLGEMVCSF